MTVVDKRSQEDQTQTHYFNTPDIHRDAFNTDWRRTDFRFFFVYPSFSFTLVSYYCKLVLHLFIRDSQAKLARIVAQCLSIHLSIRVSSCVSVRDSLSHAYVRSIARREPRRLPACYDLYFTR